MKALRFFLFVLMLTSTQLLANNLPPESVIQLMPNRTWLYTGEQANFDGSSSYDRDENGNSITNYYWYVRIGSGSYVLKASGSSATDYQICFELGGTAYATTANGCIATGSNTTATVRLKVYDDEGSYDYGYSTVTIKTPAKSRYFITDHLGNIRTTIDEDGEAMGADDYFPFGLIMPGRSNTTANANDLYKYTSHERDDEAVSDALDYMLARNYDPTLGRMNQIDPMAHVYSGISPYAYALNTPMNAIDPDGRLVIFVNGFPLQGFIGRQYWNNIGNSFFADQIMKSFPKESPMYFDGSRAVTHAGGTREIWMGNSKERKQALSDNNDLYGINSYKNRIEAGRIDGRDYASLIAQKIDSKNGETLKVITHSMGSAYARGLLESLISWMKNNPDKAFQIDFILDIAPYQGGKLDNINGIMGFQASGYRDIIANGKINNSTHIGTGNINGTHGLSAFNAEWMIKEVLSLFRSRTVRIGGIKVTIYD